MSKPAQLEVPERIAVRDLLDAYDSQAMRIRELEDTLRALRPFVAERDVPTIDAAITARKRQSVERK